MAPTSPTTASSSTSPPTSPPHLDEPPSRQSKVVSFNRGTSPMGRPHLDIISQSPLVHPRMSTEEDPLLKVMSPISSDEWEGLDTNENSKSTWFLFILTLCGLGLQIGWSVETSNGSPYLLSLGLSKSMLALVWIAGPLSGVLVQPYVGLKSDNCRIRWGKRRPFIIGGAIATIVSLLILAWARELVGGFLSIFGADPESQGVRTCVMLFAVLFVYVLDFAINVIQAAIRAYIVDVTPTHQQEAANAWFMRSSGIGNILGYLAGNVKLTDYFSFLGNSQFKILCAIASFIMALTTGISCSSCPERNPQFDGVSKSHDSIFGFFKSLARSVRNLPPQIKRVCEVQFFAWIGWFPFLFYITTYVGEIYADPKFVANPNMSDAEIDQVWEDATRVGTRALLVFAVTTFASSVFLPFIIPPTYQAPDPSRPATPATPMTPRSMNGSGYFSLKDTPKGSTSLSERMSSYLNALQIQSLTLRRSWMLSHVMFAVLMATTFFIRTTLSATILVGLIGIPWALTGWAPFALIASEISKREAMRRGLIRPRTQDAALVAAGHDDAAETGADQAGVVLGIHNVAIAAPQVIATLVSSIIFKMLQKPRGAPGDDSVAWVLRFGGCCALIAAWYTLRVHEEKQDVDVDATVRARRNS